MSYALKILAITIAFFLILEIIIYGFKMISNIDKEGFVNAPNPLEWIKNSTISNEILFTNSSKKGSITICPKNKLLKYILIK
ncbi:MAG: hypothetical protein QXF09_01850 [Nitrososphaerota archaeon]